MISAFAVMLGASAIIWCALRTRAVFPIIFLVAYQLFWTLISCAYDEQGVYLSDIQTQVVFNGSSIRLSILLGLFFAGTVAASKLLPPKALSSSCKEELQDGPSFGVVSQGASIYGVGIAVSALCVVILYANLAMSGTVLTNGDITRFNFYSDYSRLQIAQYVVYLSCGISIFLGSCLFCQKSKKVKVVACVLFVLLMAYYRLIGEEAGPLIVNGLELFLPYLVVLFDKPISANTKKKIKKAIAVLGIIMIVILGFKQSAMSDNGYYGVENQDYFVYRLMAAQSTTWIGADAVAIAQGPDLGQIAVELGGVVGQEDPESTGIWYLMKKIMPASDYGRYDAQHATLNAGYPALTEMIFGFVGAMPMVFFDGLFFYLVSYYFYRKIVGRQIVRMVLAAILFQQVCNVVTMGGIWYLSNLVPVACVIALLYIELICAWARRRISKPCLTKSC